MASNPERALYALKGVYGGQVITTDFAAADQMIAGGFAVPLEDVGLGRTPMGGKTADDYTGVTFTTLMGRPASGGFQQPQPKPIGVSYTATGSGQTAAAIKFTGTATQHTEITISGLAVDGLPFDDIVFEVITGSTGPEIGAYARAALDNHTDQSGVIALDAGMASDSVRLTATGGSHNRFTSTPTVTFAVSSVQPPPPVLAAPTAFQTHAVADAWLEEYLAVTGHDRPDDWDGSTVADKKVAAQALFEHWEADHN